MACPLFIGFASFLYYLAEDRAVGTRVQTLFVVRTSNDLSDLQSLWREDGQRTFRGFVLSDIISPFNGNVILEVTDFYRAGFCAVFLRRVYVLMAYVLGSAIEVVGRLAGIVSLVIVWDRLRNFCNVGDLWHQNGAVPGCLLYMVVHGRNGMARLMLTTF